MDTVLTILDPEKEANVDASSSDYTVDAINHNTLNESVMVDVIDDTDHVDNPYLGKRQILTCFQWRGYLQRI